MSTNTDQFPEKENESNQMEGGETAVAEKVENNKKSADSKESAEKTYTFEELEDEQEYPEDEFKEMVNLYEQTLTDFVEGEMVIGKVLAVNDKDVAVDIGFKSEGIIPIEEFNDPKAIQIGDDIEVFLDNVENKDGQLVLSKKKADFLRVWEKIIQCHDENEILEGTCMRRIKGGIVVDLMGVDAFLPGSQIDVKPIRDFDAVIGKTMDFKIVKVNELRKNIVVSHRALVEEGMKEQRAQILENLEKGQVLEGTVKNITDFGVFIDLGGVDGLLHINDLAWGRVGHPSEVVALDEKINIQILDFNEDKNRISLGLKQLQPHPWDNVKDKYKEGEIIKGKVVNISDYGSFIELEKGVEGLIHISEMSWTQHIKHPSKILSLGETVEAKILNLDFEGRKISLGLKQLEPDPWTDIDVKYPVESKQKGIVRNLTNFGAFIELEEGIDGLIHISDLSWTKKVRHPGEVVKKGDEVEVMVLKMDKGNRRISLGYKQTMENPWDNFKKAYKLETITKAKIVRMIEKGVIVELPEVVDGFVPLSQLKKEGIQKPSDAYQVGDELELFVIEFNKENKKIILSEKHAVQGEKDKPELAVDDKEAIAEFEKEVSAPGSAGVKMDSKAKSSEVVADKAEAAAEVTVETPEEVTETPEEAKAEVLEEAAVDATSDEAESTKSKAEAATEATLETPEEVTETPEEAKAEVLEEAAVETTSDEAESTKGKAEAAAEVTLETPEELTETPE
ncbi:30S ribosomal protein S1 [candidate division KSB1 bacterium]|nr:30S ribosomal protein S1 [candidate division KSB1 bacterium]